MNGQRRLSVIAHFLITAAFASCGGREQVGIDNSPDAPAVGGRFGGDAASGGGSTGSGASSGSVGSAGSGAASGSGGSSAPDAPIGAGGVDVSASGDGSGGDLAPDAGFKCGDKTCAASQFCRDDSGGPRPADGGPRHVFSCEPLPARCTSMTASCECVVPYLGPGPRWPNQNICNERNPSSGAAFRSCMADGRGHVTVECGLP